MPESIELLDGGGQAYPRMLLALARAKRSVHLEVYAFAPSGVGADFIEALGRAAGRGVAVRVQIDGWGSARGGRAVASALREAGCAVRIYNRLLSLLVGRFGRNHRKLLLIDDEVAFLGGINIGDENVGEGERPGWADLALEIRGPQCARLGQMIRREPRLAVSSSLRIFLCGLGGGWRLRRRYLKAFAGARRRIDVAHGYFLPDRGVVRAIVAAAGRGVQVRLLLAGRSDVPFACAATRSLYLRLLAAGVRIREWGGSILHAKVAVVDGRCLLVGSFNLDPFSLANLEALVEVADAKIVEQGGAWFESHFSRSRPMTFAGASALPRRWLLDPFGRLAAGLAVAFGRVVASRGRRRASPARPFSSRPRRRGPASLASLLPARKVAAAVLGFGVLAFGVALVALRGPSALAISLGLAVLATEVLWARRLALPMRKVLYRLKARAPRAVAPRRPEGPAVRAAAGTLAGAPEGGGPPCRLRAAARARARR